MPSPVQRVRRDPGLALALVAIGLAIALYAPTLGRGLVTLDDPWLISTNRIVQDPSVDSVRTILFDTRRVTRAVLGAEYLPVRDLSVMLDVAIWGDAYGGFHATNLALYVAALALWFAALVGFGIDRRVCGLAILFYAVHPAHAESVAWLSERKGVLALAFAGLAAFAYARYRATETRVAAWLAVAIVAAVLAVWSKALGAFSIAAIAGLELALPERRASARRALAGLTALGVAAGLAFIPVLVVASNLSVVADEVGAPGEHGWLAMVFGIHGFYVRLAATSMPNAISYPIETLGPSTVDIVLGATWLVVTLAVAFAPRLGNWRQPAVVRAGALIWLIGWFPASRLVLPVRLIVVADRYLLLPTLGVALVLAAVVVSAPRRYAIALGGALVLAWGMRTLVAQANWRDSASLWARAVESNRANGEAWSMYGEALLRAGDAAAAEAVVVQGLRYSTSPKLRMRYALLLLRRGERAAGQSEMQRAADGGDPVAMSNLALLLLEDGARDVALGWARRGAAGAPLGASNQRTHGKVALAAQQPAEAHAAFLRALQIEPANLDNRYNLALALVALGRPAEARAHFEACLASPSLAPLARAQLARLAP